METKASREVRDATRLLSAPLLVDLDNNYPPESDDKVLVGSMRGASTPSKRVSG